MEKDITKSKKCFGWSIMSNLTIKKE